MTTQQPDPVLDSPHRQPSLNILAARARGILSSARAKQLPTAAEDYEHAVALRNALQQAPVIRARLTNQTRNHPPTIQAGIDNLCAIATAASSISPACANQFLEPHLNNEDLKLLASMRGPASQIDPARTHGDIVAAMYSRYQPQLRKATDRLSPTGALDPLRQSASHRRMDKILSHHSDQAYKNRKQTFGAAAAGMLQPPQHTNEADTAFALLGALLGTAASPLDRLRVTGQAALQPFAITTLRLSRYARNRFAGMLLAERPSWAARTARSAGPPQARYTTLQRLRTAEHDATRTDTLLPAQRAENFTVLRRSSRNFAQALLDSPDHIRQTMPRSVRLWAQRMPANPRAAAISRMFLPATLPGDAAANRIQLGDLPDTTLRSLETALDLDPETRTKWKQHQQSHTEETCLANPEWVLRSIDSMPDPLQKRVFAAHPASDPAALASSAVADPELRPLLLEQHRIENASMLLSLGAEAVRTASQLSTARNRFAAASNQLRNMPRRNLRELCDNSNPELEDTRLLIGDIHHFSRPADNPSDLRTHFQTAWDQLPQARKKHYATLPLHASSHQQAPVRPPDTDNLSLDLRNPDQLRWLMALTDYAGAASQQILKKPTSTLRNVAGLHGMRIHDYAPHQQRQAETNPNDRPGRPKAPQGPSR